MIPCLGSKGPKHRYFKLGSRFPGLSNHSAIHYPSLKRLMRLVKWNVGKNQAERANLLLDAFSNRSDFFRRFHFHGLKSLVKFPLEKIVLFLPDLSPGVEPGPTPPAATSP